MSAQAGLRQWSSSKLLVQRVIIGPNEVQRGDGGGSVSLFWCYSQDYRKRVVNELLDKK